MVAKSAAKLFDKDLTVDAAQQQQQPQSSSSGNNINHNGNNKTAGRNLTYTIGNIVDERGQLHAVENAQLKELTNFSDNLVRPTPDEKKRSYFPKNLNVR